MEENEKLWNKKMDELTVKDVVIINFLVPAAAVGGVVVVGTAFAGYDKLASKIRERRAKFPKLKLKIEE